MIDTILNNPGSVIIDNWNTEPGSSTYAFSDPQKVITAVSADDLDDAFQAIDDLQSSGKYLAGYFAYDAGIALDKPLVSRHKPRVPLLWMGVYESVHEIEYEKANITTCDGVDNICDVRLNITEDEYLDSVRRIKNYIEKGDVYQVNYTCKMLFENYGSAEGLFARLRKAHPVCHSAFINTGDFAVISISPELFLKRTGDKILTRPMKGTERRGRFFEEDTDLCEALQGDEKCRAENIMIVDLMRNDIGRVCRYGGVSVPKMFHVEKYPSVFQMTSDVEGVVREGVSTSDILKATFPPGSITGAPKIRAMEIIDELEEDSRGIYCGSIGMFEPGGDFLLNVAIRTIVQKGRTCELGLGSGIVADSDPAAELNETLLKGEFIKSEALDFHLLETVLYNHRTGYFLLDEHLKRMRRSAEYFGWRFAEDDIRKSVMSIDFSGLSARVRLLYSRDGEIETQWRALDSVAQNPLKLLIAERQVNPNDIFLYHKTTVRNAYDDDLHAARKTGYFDFLYANINGELTECSIANIMIQIEGRWFTPPVSCGLLAGIWRGEMLAQGRATQRILTLYDLRVASRVIIGNSVRGEMEVGRIDIGNAAIFTRNYNHKG